MRTERARYPAGRDVVHRGDNQRDPGPSLIVRPLCTLQFHLVAAPMLLKREGRPRGPADIARLGAILPTYDAIFVEQLKNFANPGDLVMGISGSGNSPNVLRAMEYANSIGCKTIGLTGRDGGKLAGLTQLNIHVANPHMGRIEDAHMVICHMICYYFMDTESTR